MSVLEKVESYFQENNIEYKKIKHKRAGSAEEYHNILNTRYEQQAKALLLRYKKPGEKGFIVATLQAQKQLNLDQIKDLLQAKSIRLAEPRQLQETTGCNFGELPPLGKIFDLQLIMDKDFLNEREIYFNAGSLSDSFIINPKILLDLEKPMLF